MGNADHHPSDQGRSEHQDHKPTSPTAATGEVGTESSKTQTNPASGEDKGGAAGSEKV